jgi:hypothetical protein
MPPKPPRCHAPSPLAQLYCISKTALTLKGSSDWTSTIWVWVSFWNTGVSDQFLSQLSFKLHLQGPITEQPNSLLMGGQNLFVDILINTSVSDDTIHCTKNIVFPEIVTQPGKYISRPVGLFHIMLTMDISQRYKQTIRHHTLYKSRLRCYLRNFICEWYVTAGINIQLFQSRLSTIKAEKSNTSAKSCWESLWKLINFLGFPAAFGKPWRKMTNWLDGNWKKRLPKMAT